MKFFLAILLFSFSFAAHAGQGNYFKVGMGYLIDGDSKNKNNNVSEDFESNALNPLILGFGMYMSETMALEFELNYSDGETEDASGVKSDFSSLLLGANVLGHINTESAVKPYFGAGLTVGTYEPDPLDSEFGAGLNFMFGLDFLINEKSSIGAELRHHMTIIHPEFTVSGTDFDIEVANTELIIAFKTSL